MKQAILVVNAGSSSIKCAFFNVNNDDLTLFYRGNVTGIGQQSHVTISNAQHQILFDQTADKLTHEQAFSKILTWLEQRDDGLTLTAVGHRVVHGGTLFTEPVAIDADVITQLETLIPLAPLHQPHNIAPIKVLQRLKPTLLQVACFDTAFHAHQPEVARQFAIPRQLTKQGIKRYGFHGSSYEYITHSLPKHAGSLPERLIVAHLGNGASMAAIKQGHGVATTMGFTALDGLMMGTRCGTIDPAVVLHLLEQGMSMEKLTHTLYHESGLLGVSGISNDMQVLLDSDSPNAQEAVDLFIYRIVREVGSLSAALGGLDALVFTGGIGEHAHIIREKVCQQMTWLGVELDKTANENHARKISTTDSETSVWVLPTNEEKMIALHTAHLMQKN